ncbi:MAG: hypothetical protein CVU22_14185 [Betaproteobacteria bacterium HGW-Betaproteobacteria-16]|nr:MAG: hypothetical protein CVU22_14185 [Betaproteobacteria bacterium HGW-Betaproteobacteria-16]
MQRMIESAPQMRPMRSFSRRRFDGMEVARFDHGGQSFAPHFHDEFVLSVNLNGHEKIKLDRQTLEAEKGAITLYNPGQVQSSHAISEEWEFLSLYLDPDLLPEAFDLSPDTVFGRPVLAHGDIADDLAVSISRALDAAISEAEAAEGLLQVIDRLLVAAGAWPSRTKRQIHHPLQRVVERLCDLAPLPTLAELSAEVALTPVQLVRAFSRDYGLPPLTWAWNQRVNAARLRIARGEALAHVAADLGFADQSHLTRRFKTLYGVPPGRWQRG